MATIKISPLPLKEQKLLLEILRELQPFATEAQADALIKWAENIRTAQGLLELIENRTLAFHVSKVNHIVIRR